jgi:hypothetical protein
MEVSHDFVDEDAGSVCKVSGLSGCSFQMNCVKIARNSNTVRTYIQELQRKLHEVSNLSSSCYSHFMIVRQHERSFRRGRASVCDLERRWSCLRIGKFSWCSNIFSEVNIHPLRSAYSQI